MRPPLAHVAARYDQDIVLDWLCEQMAGENFPLDSADHHSNTAVHEAAAEGHLKCLQTLVGRGASVTILNSHGDTPGQVADKKGHDLCVGYLVVVETCMSLAQQLITLKIDNEGLRKDNENLRAQVTSMNNMKIAKAKESVEERIKATLKSLSPYEEDNEMSRTTTKPVIPQAEHSPRPQKVDIHPDHTTKNTIVSHPAPQVTVASKRAHESNETTRNESSIPATKTEDRKFEITAKFLTPAAPQQNSKAHPSKTGGSAGDAVIKSPETVAEKTQATLSPRANMPRVANSNIARDPAITHHLVTNNHGPGSKDIPQNISSKLMTHTTQSTSNALMQHQDHTSQSDAQQEVDKTNAEVQSLMNKGTTNGSQSIQPDVTQPKPRKDGSDAVKAWEKMTMDEMLKMARDYRYLPSPTVSMCTEDSTMETREVMRERLAEASRWFLGQQRGQGNNQTAPKEISIPSNHRSPVIRSTHPRHAPHQAMNSTASWVLGVQKPKPDSRLNRKIGSTVTFGQALPQQFVNATNRQYEKLQTESLNSSSKRQKDQAKPFVPKQNAFQSSSTASIASISPTVSDGSRNDKSVVSTDFGRPISAKSSISTTSTVKSNPLECSSSTLSNSTTASEDTVVENGWDSHRWRQKPHDPLQKRQINNSPVSMQSQKERSPFNPQSAPLNREIHIHGGNRDPYHENPLSASETAELRVALPSRNNSFLRKAQPSQATNQPNQHGSDFSNSNKTPAVSYPSITTKPLSPSGSQNSTGKFRPLTSPPSSTPTYPPDGVHYSPAVVSYPQKVEIVPPTESAPVDVRKNLASTGKGYSMWKPSTAQVKTYNEGSDKSPVQSPTKSAEKSKKNKHGNNTSKHPYGGLFSSTGSGSPKSNSKRKSTRLFHF